MQAMTGKERVLAALKRQDVDYVPCCPFMPILDWTQRVGHKWQYPFGPSEQEQLAYMVNELGVDQIVSFSVMGSFYPEPEVSSRVWIEGSIIHKVWTTPSGELHAAINYNEQWPHGLDIPFFSDYNPAHFAEPWIKSMKDVACLRHILLPPRKQDDLDKLIFSFKETKSLADKYQQPTCFYHGLGLTGALHMFGPKELCEFTITDPELVDAYLDLDHRRTMRFYEIALDFGADFIQRNGFYETCDFYSPAMLEKFLFNRLKDEIQLVHQAGKPIAYTLLTGIMPMLDYLARLDFDCICAPDVFMPHADAAKIVEKLGAKKSFWTGPSDTIHMPWDNPEKVREAMRYVFNTFGKRGLIISPVSGCRAVFPWNNVLAMVDEWKRLR